MVELRRRSRQFSPAAVHHDGLAEHQRFRSQFQMEMNNGKRIGMRTDELQNRAEKYCDSRRFGAHQNTHPCKALRTPVLREWTHFNGVYFRNMWKTLIGPRPDAALGFQAARVLVKRRSIQWFFNDHVTRRVIWRRPVLDHFVLARSVKPFFETVITNFHFGRCRTILDE